MAPGFSQQELELLKSAVVTLRASLLRDWRATTGDEHEFLGRRIDEYDAILKKFDAAAAADSSEDAEDEPETDGE